MNKCFFSVLLVAMNAHAQNISSSPTYTSSFVNTSEPSSSSSSPTGAPISPSATPVVAPSPSLPVYAPLIYKSGNNYLVRFYANGTKDVFLVKVKNQDNGEQFVTAYLGSLENSEHTWVLPSTTQENEIIAEDTTQYIPLAQGEDNDGLTARYLSFKGKQSDTSLLAKTMFQNVDDALIASTPKPNASVRNIAIALGITPAAAILATAGFISLMVWICR